MEDNKTLFYIVAIVAIVAIFAMVFMAIAAKNNMPVIQSVATDSGLATDNAGMAYRVRGTIDQDIKGTIIDCVGNAEGNRASEDLCWSLYREYLIQ